ncbi:MAG: hypothetical protein IBX45_13855, partial [Campylobacterales bacterium]|nr:hypothetical protein [Campylobacterales bacterium]
MAQDFIQEEAQKHSSITTEIKNALTPTVQDTNTLGNLLGATGGMVASLGKLVPGSKLLLALTTANGTMVNYGVQIAKDGENSYKAVVTSSSGAIVSTVVSNTLGTLAGRALGTVGVAAV